MVQRSTLRERLQLRWSIFDVLGDGLVDAVNSDDYEFGEDRAWLRMLDWTIGSK